LKDLLEHNRENPDDKIKFPSAIDLHKWLVAHVIEDLNVSGMLANHKLAKAVQDMGFYEFRRQLEYKTELYGSELIIADRWFPSSKTCSNCGTIKESLSLSERVFICDEYGFTLDRDLNASINLMRYGG
jgi:putative transposase